MYNGIQQIEITRDKRVPMCNVHIVTRYNEYLRNNISDSKNKNIYLTRWTHAEDNIRMIVPFRPYIVYIIIGITSIIHFKTWIHVQNENDTNTLRNNYTCIFFFFLISSRITENHILANRSNNYKRVNCLRFYKLFLMFIAVK